MNLNAPELQESALNELASSAPLATVEVAAPQLVLMACAQPAQIGPIAAVLRRLDHNQSSALLTPAVASVLSEHRTPADVRAIASLARQAYPPLLTRVRDLASASKDPDVRSVGDEIAAECQPTDLVARHPAESSNRWTDVARYREKGQSREDVVGMLDAMADTWTYLQSHRTECPAWRNRDVRSYFERLPPPVQLMWPTVQILANDLGAVLRRSSDWYATEPCLPDDPVAWDSAAACYYSAATTKQKLPGKLLSLPFVVAGTAGEFYMTARGRSFVRFGAETRPYERLRNVGSWLHPGRSYSWTTTFGEHTIRIQRDRQRWFPGFKPEHIRVFVDDRLVAFIDFTLVGRG